jgi:PAS domain S-box-containing protein/putative nucleotidyltransferase with HDIG domain
MQVNKSEYLFREFNSFSELNKETAGNQSERVIACFSTVPEFESIDTTFQNAICAVCFDFSQQLPETFDSFPYEQLPDFWSVFILLDSKFAGDNSTALLEQQNCTVLYCHGSIEKDILHTWVANILENRRHLFDRSDEQNEHGYDELIIGVNTKEQIIFWSAATRRFLGVSSNLMRNKKFPDWVATESKQAKAAKRIEKLIQGSQKEKHKRHVLPIKGNKRNTLFLVSYENNVVSDAGQSFVFLHAQNNHKMITENYNVIKDHFYGLFEFIQDAILIIDLCGYILDANEAFTQLFGYALEEIHSCSTALLFPTDELYEQSRQILLAKQKIQLATFQKADGMFFESEVSYSIFNDKKGKRQGYFLLFRDITERNKMAEEKEKIRGRLKKTQEIARLAYWRFDFEKSYFDFSDELYQILHLPKIRKDIEKRMALFDWVIAEDRSLIMDYFDNVKKGVIPPGGEFRIQTQNDVKYLYLEANNLIRNSKGDVIQVEGFLQDITARKRAEIKNLQKEMQIKSFINGMEDGYARYEIVANAEGVYDDAVLVEANDNFEKLLGINPQEHIGDRFSTFLPVNESRVLQKGIHVALTGRNIEINNVIFDEDHWFDIKIYQPIEGQFAITFCDVSDRERESIKILKQNKYLLALQETTQDFLTEQNINVLLQNIINRASELVGSENGYLDFMEPGGTMRYPRVTKGEMVRELSFPVTKGVGLTGTVWETGVPLLVEHYDDWENRIPDFKKGYFGSLIGVPILSNGRVFGVLVIAKEFDAAEILTQDDLDILMHFSRLATLAIENAQLLEKLQKEIDERKFIEAQLRNSEENYRTLFENIPDGIYRTNLAGDFLAVNTSFIKMMGYDSYQDFTKHRAGEFYISDGDREKIIASFITNQESRINAEVRLRRKDGVVIDVLENGRVIRDAEGNVQYFEGTLSDITERKQVQQLFEKQSNEITRLYRTFESLFYDQSTSLENLAKTIVNSVSQEFNQINCSMFLYEKEEHALRLLAVTEFEEDNKKISYLPVDGKGVIARAVRERKVVNVPDVSQDEDYLSNWKRSCSELCIPLMIHEQMLGVLNIESDERNAFNDDDIRLLSIFAEKAAFSVQQAINNIKEAERFEKLMHIQKLGTALSLLHDEHKILQTMLAYLKSISPGTNCIVLIFDYLKSGYRIAAHAGFDDSYHPDPRRLIYDKDLITHLRESNIYYSGDIEKVMPSIREVFPKSSMEQFVSFTLTNEGEVFGTILLTGEFASSKEDDALIEVFAKIVSSALTNARLFEVTNHAVERLESLRRIDLAIASSTDIGFINEVLLEQLNKQLHVAASDVLLFSSAGHVFHYNAGSGIHSQKYMQTPVHLGDGLIGKAALNRDILRIEDLTKQKNLDVRLKEMSDEGLTGYVGVPIIAKGAIKGLLEVYTRAPLTPTQGWMDFLEIVGGQAAIAIETIDLFSNLQRSNTDLSLAYDSTLEGWASALELRDKETEGHTRRVAELTIELAVSMNVKPDDLKNMRWGALLHDIGKMGIPDGILLKPGALTEEEWVIMRKHPEYAYTMLSKIDYLHNALDIPYYHHEKWDGTGYPRQLKGEAIPLSARIFAVVDVWDALTSDRPYREAWSKEKTMAYILEQSGSHFDPRVVEHFQKIVK